MSRSLALSLLGISVLVIVAVVVTQGGREAALPENQAENGKSAPAEHAAPTRAPPPLFAGWEKPTVVLLLSGEQHGYLEPCGCSATQSGGLARRHDLVRQIEKKGWPVVGLDLGGTLKNSRRQSAIKFESILNGLHALHYAALALGPEELRLGAENLLAQHQPDERVPFLSANIVLFGSPELGTPIAWRVVEAGGVKIGVTAILGQSYKDEVLPRGNAAADAPISMVPPEEALPKVLESIAAEKPDLLVLLSHARLDESKALAAKFPQFDLILSAGGPEDAEKTPQRIGKTLLTTVGAKGKHVGVLGYFPKAKDKLRYEAVDLDNRRFENTPEMHELMRAYQERLQSENITLHEPPIRHPSGAAYVGAKTCGECHKKAFNKWQGTKHAHAYESLSKGRKGQEADWVSRVHDAECIACHVTGWHPQQVLRYTSGFETPEKTPHLMGQQCENCHGPGSRHVEVEELWKKKKGAPSPEVVQERKAMHLDKEIAKNRVCYECHDTDNSPSFQFDKYWKDVEHPWRD